VTQTDFSFRRSSRISKAFSPADLSVGWEEHQFHAKQKANRIETVRMNCEIAPVPVPLGPLAMYDLKSAADANFPLCSKMKVVPLSTCWKIEVPNNVIKNESSKHIKSKKSLACFFHAGAVTFSG
jgi:hypothetical protein